MSLASVKHAISEARRDGVVTGAEMRRIIREAEKDGVLSPRERSTLSRFIANHGESSFTDDAKAQASAFMEKYGIEATQDRCTKPMGEVDAMQLIIDNFNQIDIAAGIGDRDGLIARSDLQAVIDSTGASPKLKQAARYLMQNFSNVDDAAGLLGHNDGRIAISDLQAAIAQKQMDPAKALDVVRKHFDYLDTAAHIGKTDGIIGTADLDAAIHDPKASADVKAAAHYILDHPELIGKPLFRRADLEVADTHRSMTPRSAVETILRGFDQVDVAAGIGKRDGIMAQSDLRAVADNANAPADLRAAARYLLDHPGLYEQLDDAAHVRGFNDGLVATKDLDAWLARHPATAEPVDDRPDVIEADDDDDGPDNVVQLPTASARRSDRSNDASQAQIEDTLADPTLTIEDKVTLVLMLIMKQMDKQIEQQLQHVDKLQKQQEQKTANGENAKDTSIDTETLKLKRMIDKRSQMFDMLRQVIDKYNQTAKGIIDTISR